MTHSCLSATGSPMQLQWAEAGAVILPVADSVFVHISERAVENRLCEIHEAP